MDYVRLSKELSYILRHNPQIYGLELDEYGYVSIDKLLISLNRMKHYKEIVEVEDIVKSIQLSNKERLEIVDNKIRALYGHSISLNINKQEAMPPETLYHGTSRKNLQKILKSGLKSMERLYVHLSSDIETALLVGKRRDDHPVLLFIDTKKALESGSKFYIGNNKVWLSSAIPAECISIVPVEKE